jgi:hypothetical protein
MLEFVHGEGMWWLQTDSLLHGRQPAAPPPHKHIFVKQGIHSQIAMGNVLSIALKTGWVTSSLKS